MKVHVPGHLYELEQFELGESQLVQFINKVPSKEPGELITVDNGTTNEEVLEMLIDRMQYLISKVPSRESALALTKLEEALLWLNKRTANRKARGVEGTSNL